jgi:hypothetical protein
VLFPTHLVAAYLLTARWDFPPALTVVGGALPDLVDKPVAMAGVYSLYHSAGHSAVVLVLATLLGLGFVALRDRHRTGVALLAVRVGWASHLALDAVHMLFNGRPGDARFLAWPLVEHAPAVRLPPLEFAVHYVGTPALYLELLVWAAFAAVLARRVRSRADSNAGA